MLPYFRRAENQERGSDDYHGAGGPLDISDLRASHELHDAFIAAAQEAGFMPTVISSNTNAAAIIIAEKASDLILAGAKVGRAAGGASARAA